MKALSISVLILTLLASPAGAAMVTIQNGDRLTRCGLTAARLISEASENGVVFPEESRDCGEIADETVDDAKTEVIGNIPITTRALGDSFLEIVALFRLTNH